MQWLSTDDFKGGVLTPLRCKVIFDQLNDFAEKQKQPWQEAKVL